MYLFNFRFWTTSVSSGHIFILLMLFIYLFIWFGVMSLQKKAMKSSIMMVIKSKCITKASWKYNKNDEHMVYLILKNGFSYSRSFIIILNPSLTTHFLYLIHFSPPAPKANIYFIIASSFLFSSSSSLLWIYSNFVLVYVFLFFILYSTRRGFLFDTKYNNLNNGQSNQWIILPN